VTERIVIASKGRLDRAHPQRARARDGLPSVATIPADEFMEATLDVWELPTESASRVGHPAPFPIELPRRVIELHTYEGDLVLDPFMGSGTTALAALETGRHYVGYDMDADYVALAESRLAARRLELATDPPDPLPRDRVIDVAKALLAECGMTDVDEKVRPLHGVPIALAARDAAGRRVLFDIAGGFTTGPRGLRKSELLWRTLGRAATLAAADRTTPLVVLTTELPPKASANAKALRLAVGDTIAGVVDLSARDAAAQLAAVVG
jgi:site-specific DNA-methyltransferase (adenine-specific)